MKDSAAQSKEGSSKPGTGSPEPEGLDSRLSGGVPSSRVESDVFQGRRPRSSEESGEDVFSAVKGRTKLWVIAGPTGAGKTTLEKTLPMIVPDMIRAEKMMTDSARQPQRIAESGRKKIWRREFDMHLRRGEFVFAYDVSYEDSQGEGDRISYGLTRSVMIDGLKKGDVVMTLTDPRSFEGFFRRVPSELTQLAYIIPVVCTTSDPNDLIVRLHDRECSASERERRLKQVMPQWEFFNGIAGSTDYVIRNDTGIELLAVPQDVAEVPRSVVGPTLGKIDSAVKKMVCIVRFHKFMEKYMANSYFGTDLDVHGTYVNHLALDIFGQQLEDVLADVRGGREQSLNNLPQQKTRLLQATEEPIAHQHLLETMRVTGMAVKDGVARFFFNDIPGIYNMAEASIASFMKHLSEGQGFWKEDGIYRFSLTDDNPYSDGKIYALELCVRGEPHDYDI